METANSTSSGKPPATHSCDRCAVRKVKCDKQHPCSACQKHDARCEYRPLPPPRRRKRADRTEVLKDRLDRYERQLRRKGVDPDTIAEETIQTPSSRTSKENDSKDGDASSSQASKLHRPAHLGGVAQTQLLHHRNRSKYLENGLWTRVVEELAEAREALGNSSDEDDDEHEPLQRSVNVIFGQTPTSVSNSSAHPPSGQIIELWQIFLDNFDPLTKIVHGPSLGQMIQTATSDLSSISKSLEALLFAIYGAAVVTLKSDECERRFGDTRKELLSRYLLATQTALSRANLTGSASLMVLQAFVIHLFSMREVYSARTIWVHTGLALRIAEGMGLHRDGSILGLSPFETEIRRRIWWQLKLLDGDSAELSGSSKIKKVEMDDSSPKFPTNLNDDQLHPSLVSIPTAVDGATDMIFCGLRVELRTYYAKKSHEKGQQDKANPFAKSSTGIDEFTLEEFGEAIDELEKTLETKFLRFCDLSQPIQLMTTLLARCAVNVVRLMIHHPRKWSSENQITDADRQYVWDLSVTMLKQYNMIDSSRELERFSWHAAFWFRWQPFIHVLDTLRTHPIAQEAEQVWHLIDEIFNTSPDFVLNRRKALYIAVGNLCLKAYASREAALAKEGKPTPSTPWYIKEYRKQRESAAAARRNNQAVTAKPVNFPLDEASQMAQYQPELSQMQPELVQPGLVGDWSTMTFSNPAGDDFGGYYYFTDDAPVDIDMLLGLDDPMNKPIDWDMWDSLMSDFN